jgi:CheY-like chemotaxis protein
LPVAATRWIDIVGGLLPVTRWRERVPDPTDHLTPVLVVEDDALLRTTMVDHLEDAGFSVFEASTGDEGISELARVPELRAILTEIEMPGKTDGLKLARITHELYPKIAVVVMSGRVRPEKHELPPFARFFGKPYSHDEIVDALHEMMGTKAKIS